MSYPITDWSSAQRQSPAALIIILLKVARSVLRVFWPLVIIYFVRGRSGTARNWELVIAFIPVIVLVRAVMEYISFRFYILNNDFIIKKGIFQKQTITIPLEKIQAVHIEQTFLHGLLGVAKIAFDSAGTEKIEVKIDAVLLARAQELKSFILQSGLTAADETKATTPEQNLVFLQWKDLLKLSISSNHIEAFFIIIGFLFSVFENTRELLSKQFSKLLDETSIFFINSTVGIILALVMFSLFISVIVSTGRTLLRYYNFQINRNEKGFRISSGLINVREKLLPFRKIQYISWRSNWLRARLGLSLVQFHSIGGDEIKQKQQIKVPVTRYSFIATIARPYHSLEAALGGTKHFLHPSYAVRKLVLPGLPFGALPALVAWPWWHGYALLFLLLLPYVYFSALIAVKRFRLYLSEESLFIHRGVLGTEELLVKWHNIQKVSLRQSIYQRRHRLATLKLHTAGGVITIPFIVLELAQRICNHAFYQVESKRQHWM